MQERVCAALLRDGGILMVRHARKEYCYLVAITAEQEPTLGYDPELPREAQMLTDLAWFPLEQVRHDRQVSKVLAALERDPQP